MPYFRIYRVDYPAYEFVAEVEADRPRTAMAMVRAVRPGLTITCNGAGIGSNLICVPAAADRIAQLIARVESYRKHRLELFRVYSLRAEGERFVYEVEDELWAESAGQVEERVRSRLRRRTGLRVRFGNPYSRRDARDPGVLYCRTERVEDDTVERIYGPVAASQRLSADTEAQERIAAQRSDFEAARCEREATEAIRAAEEQTTRMRGECLVCLRRGRRGARHHDPFFHISPAMGLESPITASQDA